ncbi:laccase-14-like protein [Corchorus olitorius]|uniref:Laccase-14-like protein n=1 Tax=Corchorus olitorius TaxID=93759 RepID=A0A1R3HUR7_9ROSI|nr:laccase-14-like protein [Corchorus olitorius]
MEDRADNQISFNLRGEIQGERLRQEATGGRGTRQGQAQLSGWWREGAAAQILNFELEDNLQIWTLKNKRNCMEPTCFGGFGTLSQDTFGFSLVDYSIVNTELGLGSPTRTLSLKLDADSNYYKFSRITAELGRNETRAITILIQMLGNVAAGRLFEIPLPGIPMKLGLKESYMSKVVFISVLSLLILLLFSFLKG